MKKVKPMPITALIVFTVGAVSAAVHILMNKSPQFADRFNSGVSYWYRRILSSLTGFIPISFAEFLLYVSPVLLICICVLFCKYISKGKVYLMRAVCIILCIPIVAYSMFVLGLAPGYRCTPIEYKLGLVRTEVSADDLYRTTMSVITELNSISQNIIYDIDGASVMPYTLDEMNAKLSDAYIMLCEDYPFINTFKSKTKPLIISKFMTYTHLSGMYTFFTGEANINTNYPDFVVAYSAAHEMAHQRGISKEDEANFCAFLVCKASDDEYLQYSAYINMYQYLSEALYKADNTLYASATYSLYGNVKNDFAAYSRFFDKYRENKAAQVSEKMNNDYLVSQGTDGIESYGMVVDLAVAYYKK